MATEIQLKATEIQLIPIQELSTGQAAHIRNAAIRAVEKKASDELRLQPDKLLTRDIQPKDDLDYTFASWFENTGATTAQYEDMISKTLGDDRYMAIYGVLDLSPWYAATKIRINVGNSIKAVWMLENLYPVFDSGPRIGFSPAAIIVPQNTPLLVERYVNQANLGANIVLKGVICERIGKVFSP